MKLVLKQLDPEFKKILEVRPPVRVKHFLVKRYHLKRLHELSLKSIGQIPQLDEPNYEQKGWIVRKMKAPASAWRSFR